MTRRYLVGGRVQGVGFRFYARRSALQLGLSGWVRNLDDGKVEVLATGTPDRLSAFELQLRSGPAGASVSDFMVLEISDEAESLSNFQIR